MKEKIVGLGERDTAQTNEHASDVILIYLVLSSCCGTTRAGSTLVPGSEIVSYRGRGDWNSCKSTEEMGRRDGRMKANEAGTTMALRGEHDDRSASAQDEGRLNWARVETVNQDVKPIANWAVVEAGKRIEASEIWPTIGSKRARRQRGNRGDGQRRQESGVWRSGYSNGPARRAWR